MKKIQKYLVAALCISLLLYSCENEIDNDVLSTSKVFTENISNEIDSLGIKDVIALEETEELRALHEKMDQLKIRTRSTFTYDDRDENFSSNMWAIRELPITLQARGQANTNNKYLSTNGKNKEITLANTTYSNQKFYIRVLPASTGIPYLIYSNLDKTPISVGQYKNNPNNKILYTLPNESGLYGASWNFIPSTYRGYYAIQSQSYLAQSDPNNPWSIFYHVLEVKDNNKIGYAQYTKKAQQEFLIKPDAYFTLKDIQFVNSYSAKVTQRANLAIQQAYTNSTPQQKRVNMEFNRTVQESSYFKEKNGIAFNLYNSGKLFARPSVTLGDIDLTPNNAIKADTYYRPNIYQNINKELHTILPVVVKPRHKLVMTYYYKVYDVEVDFIATIVYNDREAKIAGRWSGRLHIDEIFEPEFDEIDLNTNQTRSGKISTKNVTKLTPITF